MSTRIWSGATNHNWPGLEDTRNGSKAEDNTSFVSQCSTVECDKASGATCK